MYVHCFVADHILKKYLRYNRSCDLLEFANHPIKNEKERQTQT